jgi:hypothetical protein
MKRLTAVIGVFFALAAVAVRAAGWLPLVSASTGGGTGSCSQSQAFFARASATHSNGDALDTLICTGLAGNSATCTGGTTLWDCADIIYLPTQPNVTDAKLNLKSSSFSLTVNGSPTFTVNKGYVGAASANLDTGWQAGTNGVRYTQNSMGAFAWKEGAATSCGSGNACGVAFGENAATVALDMYPHFSDNGYYSNIQSTTGFFMGTGTINEANFYGFTRSVNGTGIDYKNTTALSAANAATALLTVDLLLLNDGVAAGRQFTTTLGFVWIGGFLDTTPESNLCHAVNVYMTAVAGDAGGIC